MSPVHVIVSNDPNDEQRYAAAFGGAINLYRFRSNVEAFERLTAARSPIDVLVVMPNQDSLFNMTPAQLAERLTALPMASNPNIGNLKIVVVGAHGIANPRVHAVASVDAAVRLVMFGDVSSAPAPAAPAAHAAPAAPGLASDVIASIWAPAPAAHAAPPVAGATSGRQLAAAGGPGTHAPPQHVQMPRGTAGLRSPAPQQVAVYQPAAHVGSQGAEGIVATVMPDLPLGLEPAVPYQLEGGGVYNGVRPRGGSTAFHHGGTVEESNPVIGGGPASAGYATGGIEAQWAPTHDQVMAGAMHAPVHPGGGQPAYAPQLAGQMQALVYAQAEAPSDPLLGWSAPVQQQLAAQQPAMAPVQQQVAMQAMSAPQQVLQHAHQNPPANGQQPERTGGGLRGKLGLMRDRVREGERAPLAPNATPSYAPQQSHAHAAPAAPAGGMFDAPAQLLDRANGDIRFG